MNAVKATLKKLYFALHSSKRKKEGRKERKKERWKEKLRLILGLGSFQ